MSNLVDAEIDVDPKDLVRILLEGAHIAEPPTNAERIARYLGLTVRGFSHQEFGLDLRIRAFLWPSEKLIGVDRKMSLIRQTFSILHEIGHYVLPGHVTAASNDKFIDKDTTLSIATIIKQEIEANRFAADCLFQLDGFDMFTRDQQLSWKNIKQGADIYGASIESTARRWIERTEKTCGLVAFSPHGNQLEAPLTITYVIVSDTFRQKYFSRLTEGQKLNQESFAYKFFYGIEYADDPIDQLSVRTPDGIYEIRMHLFSNRHRLFGLLTPDE